MENPELDEQLHAASALSDEGRWDEAFDLLLDQEVSHPEDPTLLCMLGAAANAVGAEGRAYEYFRRCLAQNPTDPVLLTTAGSGLAAFDDPEAESALRLAALTAPDQAFTRLHYGGYLAREGHFDTAIGELEAARALDAEDVAVRTELAVAYLLARRLDDGIAEMEEAMARAPADPGLTVLHALALLEVGRSDEAAEELHRAAIERPEDTEAQLLAALASAAQGWDNEAWDALARAEVAGTADPSLLEAVEESIEAGAEAAQALLSQELAPSLLRVRLLERP